MRVALYIFFALAGLQQSFAARADVFLRVGSDAACNFPTIQEAINFASNANGRTGIYINRTQTWSNQQLDINGKNIVLYGGYADCSASSPSGRTTLSGSDSATRPLLTIRGATTDVELVDLNLESNSNTGSVGGAGFGGAIAVRGGPHVGIYLIDVDMRQSKARFGGGLYVNNEFSSNQSDVYVLVLGSSSIDNNHGDYGGGGLWCSHARVVADFFDASFLANQTAGTVGATVINGPGGGIRAEGCNVDIIGGQSGFGSVAFNTAGGNGGGISASGGSLIRLYSLSPDIPAGAAFNIAGGTGGGIDIESNSHVQAWDAIIDGNTARAGGGAVAIDESSNDGFDASFSLRGDLVGAPPGIDGQPIVLCTPALRCNRIDYNQAMTTSNTPRPGAAILVHSGSTTSDQFMAPTVALYGTELYGNSGTNLITSSGDLVDTQLHGTAVFNNTASSYLVDVSASESAFFGMYASTIAGNTSAGGNSRSIQRSSVVGMNFKNSIHWQPGKRITLGLGLNSGAIDYVLANDSLDASPSNHGSSADPQFINPANQDYRLKPTSPAVDYTIASADPTANHLPRLIDLAPIANQYGAQDLGAYERQTLCGDDTIFCSGFDF